MQVVFAADPDVVVAVAVAVVDAELMKSVGVAML